MLSKMHSTYNVKGLESSAILKEHIVMGTLRRKWIVHGQWHSQGGGGGVHEGA